MREARAFEPAATVANPDPLNDRMIGPGFHLGEAPPQRMARDRLTFHVWAAGRRATQYLDLERTLRRTTHHRLAMRSWALPRPNHVAAASCETFRLPLAPSGIFKAVASVSLGAF